MNVLRSGLCAVALWSALSIEVAAKDKTPAAPPPEPCNFLCGLQSYLSTDHMMASAPEPSADQTQKPKARAKKPVASASRKAAPASTAAAVAASAGTPPVASPPKAETKPRVAVRASKAPEVQAAAEPPPATSKHRRNLASAQRSAAWVQPPIPGSAPTVTADFAPAQ